MTLNPLQYNYLPKPMLVKVGKLGFLADEYNNRSGKRFSNRNFAISRYVFPLAGSSTGFDRHCAFVQRDGWANVIGNSV